MYICVILSTCLPHETVLIVLSGGGYGIYVNGSAAAGIDICVCVCVSVRRTLLGGLTNFGLGVHAKGICYRRVEDINLYV